MGIRISKEIGYFLPLEKFSNIIVDNYEDILEKIDYKPEKYLEKFFKGYENYKPQSKKNGEEIFIRIMGHQYRNNPEKVNPDSLVKTVLFYDEVVGLLVVTPELAKERRYDNLMDYYENIDGNGECSINYLHNAIYPSQGYIYTGGLEQANEQEVKKGTVLGMYEVKQLFPETKNLTERERAKFVTNSGYFRPNIEAGAFIIAKAFGLLQKHIKEDDFNNVFEPVILTSWG